eukprot:365716-Chlamydomonas_euryale.AAC.5
MGGGVGHVGDAVGPEPDVPKTYLRRASGAPAFEGLHSLTRVYLKLCRQNGNQSELECGHTVNCQRQTDDVGGEGGRAHAGVPP